MPDDLNDESPVVSAAVGASSSSSLSTSGGAKKHRFRSTGGVGSESKRRALTFDEPAPSTTTAPTESKVAKHGPLVVSTERRVGC